MPGFHVKRKLTIAAVAVAILVIGIIAAGVAPWRWDGADSGDDQSTPAATTEQTDNGNTFSRMSDRTVCKPAIAKSKEFGVTDSIKMGAVAEEFKGCQFKSARKSAKYLFRIAATNSMDPVCNAGSKENDAINILDVEVCLNHDKTGEFNVDGERWKGDTMKSDFAVNGITVEVVSQTNRPYTLANWPWKEFHHALLESTITTVKNAK